MSHPIDPACQGKKCRICGAKASHKVEEVFRRDQLHGITFENGSEVLAPQRHPLTASVCCACFGMIVGPQSAVEWAGCALPPPREPIT